MFGTLKWQTFTVPEKPVIEALEPDTAFYTTAAFCPGIKGSVCHAATCGLQPAG
jgi:hypothetical protein